MKSKSELRIAFLGTPEFAVPSLRMLVEGGYQVCGVFAQPARPKGRGHKLIAPPVKEYAQEQGIPVFQFERISRDGMQVLEELAPDLLITAAFGQILSRALLEKLPLGCINVHASLLPKYRGAAPIEQAILHGEKKTGITTMYTVYEIDAGDILEQDELEIAPEDTGGSLREKLSLLGAKTLSRTLEKLLETLPPEFRRVHRSFVVNADNIQRVVLSQNLVYLRGDVAVPLSRSYKKEVREYDA